MGRTLLPFRMALEDELATWKRFQNGLNSVDHAIIDDLLHYARKHADAGSLAARPLLSEIIFMSVAIEQQKTIERLNEEISALRNQIEILEQSNHEQ